MRWPAYPKYKGSGVDWLGEVPEGWEIWKFSHGFDIIGSGTTPSTENERFYDGNIPWITTGELRENVITSSKSYVSEYAMQSLSVLRIYPKGALVIAMYGATIGRVAILGISATVNQACCVMCSSSIFDARFIFYFLQISKEQILLSASGGGQPNISQEIVKSLRCFVPNIDEQKQIACFIDSQLQKYDFLIAEQEKLIALLQEKRQAVISHAVTKGLNPDAPMKDSGVEWLGMIPEGWSVYKLGFVCMLKGGFAFKTEDFSDEGIPIVRMSNLKRGRLDFDEAVFYPQLIAPYDFLLNEDDILWGMSGSIGETGSLGNFAVATKADLPALLNQRVGRFVLDKSKLSKFFFTYYIQTKIFYDQIIQFSTGTAQFNVSSEQVESCYFSLPQLSEQQAIVNWLDVATSRIDELLSEAKDAIALLKERRTALISAAVTGKIDVRGLTASEPA